MSEENTFEMLDNNGREPPKNTEANPTNQKADNKKTDNSQATSPGSPPAGTEPSDEQIYQNQQAGPILMPVGEVTEMMAGLEREKLTGAELRQKLVDEHATSKYWRAQALKYMNWYNTVQQKLSVAQAKNESYVQIPPLPLTLPEATENEPKSTVSEDKELLREFGKVVGPYLAIGKYLKGDDYSKPNSLPFAPLIMYDDQGNKYEIPAHLAPFYMPTQNLQPQSQPSQPTQAEPMMPNVTIQRGDNKFTIPVHYVPFFMNFLQKQGLSNPNQGQGQNQAQGMQNLLQAMPTIKRTYADGTTDAIPAWMAFATPSSYHQGDQATPPSEPSTINSELDKISKQIEGLKQNNSSLPNSDELDRFNSLLDLIDRVEDRRYKKTRAGGEAEGESSEPDELKRHRISEEEETKREKEKTKQKTMETFGSILGSSNEEEEEKKRDHARKEKVGREFLNETIKKAREQNILVSTIPS